MADKKKNGKKKKEVRVLVGEPWDEGMKFMAEEQRFSRRSKTAILIAFAILFGLGLAAFEAYAMCKGNEEMIDKTLELNTYGIWAVVVWATGGAGLIKVINMISRLRLVEEDEEPHEE